MPPHSTDGEGFMNESSFTRLRLLDACRIEEGILLHWIVSES